MALCTLTWQQPIQSVLALRSRRAKNLHYIVCYGAYRITGQIITKAEWRDVSEFEQTLRRELVLKQDFYRIFLETLLTIKVRQMKFS